MRNQFFYKKNFSKNVIKKFTFNFDKAILRKIALLLIDCFIFFQALFLSSFLLSNKYFFINNFKYSYLHLSIIIPIYVISGQYKSLSRYASIEDFYKIIYRNFFILFIYILFDKFLPFNVNSNFFFILFLFISIFSGIIRFSLRDFIFRYIKKKKNKPKKVIIYGADKESARLASIIRKENSYEIIAFIDDSPDLVGLNIYGKPIYSSNDLDYFEGKINQVLISDSNIKRSSKLKIINNLKKLGVPLLELPSLDKFVSGKTSFDLLKPISIEELLGRDSVKPIEKLTGPGVNDVEVLVTGAGGSIGKGLCKQLIALKPKKLILLEISEYALYLTHQELLEINSSVEILPVLQDCRNEKALSKLFQENNIKTIFHAAAYKHVPLVEANPLAGLSNNVMSTKVICSVAIDFKIRNLIFVSTDKAVRPTNVMGASKRLAELIVLAFAGKEKNIIKKNNNSTIFSMVRFGNVLGSSGSVIPLFLKQIKEGGPITLTHEKVIRYFMTIDEACILLIQSISLSKGGDLFLLDMGEPVLISHLAKQMILLSGMSLKDKDNQNGDIEINITGLRPGEKLYEELLIDGEALKTEHPLIFKTNEKKIVPSKFFEKLKVLEKYFKEQSEDKALALLSELVPEWKKSNT